MLPWPGEDIHLWDTPISFEVWQGSRDFAIVPDAMQLPNGTTMQDIFSAAGFTDEYFQGLQDDGINTKCTVPPRDFLKAISQQLGDESLYRQWLPKNARAEGQTKEWLSNDMVGLISFEGLSRDEAWQQLQQIQALSAEIPIFFAYKPNQNYLDENPGAAWHNGVVGTIGESYFAYYIDQRDWGDGEISDNTWFAAGPQGKTISDYQAGRSDPLISLLQAGAFTGQVPINTATNDWRRTWYQQLTYMDLEEDVADQYGQVYFFYLKQY
jgi:hypothetical protein